MSKLIALAERCEAATGPSREINAQIAEATGWRDVCKAGYGSWRGLRPTSGKREAVCPFTASLDAAMTLVPEGAVWGVHNSDDPHPSVWKASVMPLAGPAGETLKAKSPALALCAAALRAQAKDERHD